MLRDIWSTLAQRAASLFLAGAVAGVLIVLPAQAAFDFPVTPDWESTPQSHVATGCALRDLDGDDLPDLIVANGNDIYRQPLVVYRNQGGTFPATPTWVGSTIDYHGHLDLADVDGDGYLDCAVAVYLGPSGFGDRGGVKLYRGNGDGTFSANPVWTASDRFYCFSVSFGDIDMDGRPDLACATGESYDRHKERHRVYRNVGGALESLPYWQSAGLRYAYDVTWGDVNNDGILDLAFASESNPTPQDPETYPPEVYFGTGMTLQSTPGWRAEDGHDCANTLVLGDVNGDGFLDLAVADNNQLTGGSQDGRTSIYLNDGLGNLGTLPAWVSNWNGYGSHVSLIDADYDVDLDLVAGGWWSSVRIYENNGGSFPANPTWSSSTGSVIENIAWEDVDNDGRIVHQADWRGDGETTLFRLSRWPVRIIGVSVDGVTLEPTGYFGGGEKDWVSLAAAPRNGARVIVDYAASVDPDFVVSNWDTGEGNYLFRNRRNPSGISLAEFAADGPGFRLSPNPAWEGCAIVLERPLDPRAARAEVFGPTGALVRVLPAPGVRGSFWWDGRDASGRAVPAGSYWVRVAGVAGAGVRRLVLLP